MKEHLEFAFKVAVVILVINQFTPLANAIGKNYFSSAA